MASASLRAFVSSLPQAGTFSLWVGPVEGDAWTQHAADEEHYAASTMKLALLVAAYRQAEAGLLDLDRPVVVHNHFVSAHAGEPFSIDPDDDSDPEVWRRMGTAVAPRWLGHRAIVRSSNLATNLLLEQVGVAGVEEALDVCGAKRSVVTRGIEDTAARDSGLHNIFTARDLAGVLRALAQGTAASPAGCGEMLSVLAAQQIADAIPAGLPPGTEVAHKSGWVDGVSHDAGIVYPGDAEPFVFVMCTTSGLDAAAALRLIADGAAAAWADRRARP